MRDIKIMRLSLENFKCHKHLVLDFMGRDMSIYGDNATGKTSVYDALTWLLFGKDSHGNGEKNVEIKPLDADGSVRDHMAVTTVNADLMVDGEMLSLRRTYREVWNRKRGQAESAYDGNTSEYAVDGVPMQKKGFTEKVAELVDEDTFRMLTGVSCFSEGISWQERRKVLFDVAGVMEDAQILASDSRFTPLTESLGRLTVADYKKKLLAEKKNFTGTRNDIPARISECEKTVQEVDSIDFQQHREAWSEKKAQREKIVHQISEIDNNSAVDSKRNEAQAAQLAIRELDSKNQEFRNSQPTNEGEIHRLGAQLSALQLSLADRERTISFVETTTIGRAQKQIQQLRDQWAQVNAEVFSGDRVCPTCGQDLPQEKVDAAIAYFEKQKQERLKRIQDEASSRKVELEQAEIRLQEVRGEAERLKAEVDACEKQLEEARQGRTPIEDMPGYAEQRQALEKQYDERSRELAELTLDAQGRKSELSRHLAEIDTDVRQIEKILSKEGMLEYAKKRIGELRVEARNAGAALESIEQMLFLIDEFSRYKTKVIEDSINNMFRIARFRLFREQANGGVEDRCDVVYDGVPYTGLNNGMKINVGIDIINTLSRAYGVSVPLFIDNAESVTRLENSNMQTIRLVVSEEDKELRVSEN